MTNAAKAPLAVQLKTLDVPKCMVDGEKVIKWDEDSGVGTPVTLRVDKNGFYLYWLDQNKEMDLLDIATIRDCRTGKQAKIPKDPKLRLNVTMGSSQDLLEDKTVTLCHGSDFVNLTFINFCCTKKETAQLWTDELLKLAFNLSQLNGSVMKFLLKAHTKLQLSVDKSSKIPIKNIIKMFTQNKEDRKRVKTALESAGISTAKDEVISPEKFSFEEFFNFYKHLTQRTEAEKIFEELCGSKKKLMSASQLVEFLNLTQRDPRLNEILHPYANVARAKDIIAQYEINKNNVNKGQLSFEGFLRYMMSEDNPIVAPSKVELCDDMDQPLAHYFINSSHNTYLTGHQLTGKSSVEIYRQCLLAGCRCVELDFWNGGRTEEPVIVHGYTFVPEIPAKDVIEAIAESAFKTSDYPVILSFENHCNPRQQAKIAQYCRDIFGDMLLDSPLDSHKLEAGVPLPPPSLLKRKIIIKNKKKHHHNKVLERGTTGEIEVVATGNGDVPHAAPVRQSSKESADEKPEEKNDEATDENVPAEDDLESSSGDEDEKPLEKDDKVASAKETEAGAEISALVNYVQPVHFVSFEITEKKNRFYEMSSFDEKQATMLLKESPIEFVKYNKQQLSRVYPAGTRFDSSNFMPQVFWNAGCQLVALNYQTLDLAMQLNLGIFEYNQRCGYLLKPEFMRRQDRRFDPFAESTVDGIIAGTVSINVISGQFLTDKRCGTYVEVDMYGLPADTVRKKFRTKIVPNNGINPVYDEEPFVFKKVVLPELACIRITAYEEGGKFIGHRVLPVIGLCPGYRHVTLRTECGQPLQLATLFLHVVVKDYVPEGFSDFAEALANPIKYQSELDKRAQQLAVLTDLEESQDVWPSTEQEEGGNQSDEGGPPPAPRLKRIGSMCPEMSGGATGHNPAHRASIAVAPLPTTMEEPQPVTSPEVIHVSPPRVTTQTTTNFLEDMIADPVESFLESKSVKEKRLELEKKLEALRKKQDKERMRLASADSDKPRTKFYMSNKLVKRLSSKNMDTSGTPEGDGEGGGDGEVVNRGIPRSHSERMLAIFRDHITQERELVEKYHEQVFANAQKVMQASQSQQLKMLHVLLERETSDVMRRLQNSRKQEVKALAKQHRDRDELVRMKREVASAMVEKGVHERVRLTQIYEKKREELERQHNEVKNQLTNEKAKAKNALIKELEKKSQRIEQEIELEPRSSER
ncbi:1-phosphatidylinositol 4,5-bisphosphate phosphodiesterase classes I and II isoform X2 [Cimex lectularius]|uniref:1-phosphatidylinositol 4,5-bisphosphate phosphodiesterase n=1 Tax=Cimex lectularius TaxID=79782 RepID=A0A8I6RT02_CIMLE|nr:1-phosphatidylinositol 4,5-bisphosphate phosphodiesterase classes I and II isoform X2 [Cimex lectularius]